MKTLGQKRAHFALQKIMDASSRLNSDEKDSLKSLSASAPAMILQNGLGHTLSFLYAKSGLGGDPRKQKRHIIALLNAIVEWLQANFNDLNGNNANNNVKNLILSLADIDQSLYLAAQQEALHMLEWYKRYANSGFLLEENRGN